MTFEDWFGTGHRLDDHDKQVAELMRMAWNMADKSARNECIRLIRNEALNDAPTQSNAAYNLALDHAEKAIQATIK